MRVTFPHTRLRSSTTDPARPIYFGEACLIDQTHSKVFTQTLKYTRVQWDFINPSPAEVQETSQHGKLRETWQAKLSRLLASSLHPAVTCQAELLRLYLFQDVTERRIGAMATMSTNLKKQLRETKDFRIRKASPRYQASMVVCLKKWQVICPQIHHGIYHHQRILLQIHNIKLEVCLHRVNWSILGIYH